MNVALFCVLRNEHIYVKEYIEHYYKLGFTHIYFCDNSSNDTLESFIDEKYKNFVSIIDIRSHDLIKEFTKYQTNLYTSLYNIYSFKYDWLCFFDIDELLILNQDNTIEEYLSRDIFKDVDQIHFNWLVFGDNDQLYYEDKPCVERFTRISNKYYELYGIYANGIKSMLKCGLDLHFITMHTAISNTENKLNTTDNDGFKYDESYSTHAYVNYNLAQLNHYITKSTQEYLGKNLGSHTIEEFINKYFKINEYTEEKENMLKSNLLN